MVKSILAILAIFSPCLVFASVVDRPIDGTFQVVERSFAPDLNDLAECVKHLTDETVNWDCQVPESVLNVSGYVDVAVYQGSGVFSKNYPLDTDPAQNVSVQVEILNGIGSNLYVQVGCGSTVTTSNCLTSQQAANYVAKALEDMPAAQLKIRVVQFKAK